MPTAKRQNKRATAPPEPLPADLEGLSTVEVGSDKPHEWNLPFRVDFEFRDLIPRPTEEERAALLASLLREGCREPLVVWQQMAVLVDGHTRAQLCDAEDIPVRCVGISFANRDEAKEWIIANQLARRNLPPERMSYLRGKKLELEKMKKGGNKKPPKHQPDASVAIAPKPSGKTAEKIAKQTGVSTATVERDAVFARAVDALANQGASRQELLNGRKKMSQAAAQFVATLPPSKAREVARKLNIGYATVDSALPAKATALQQAARATKQPNPETKQPNPETKPPETKPGDVETEAWQTVLNRLTEIKSVMGSANFRGVRTRILDLIRFVEGRL